MTSQPASVINLVAGRYFLNGTLDIGALSNVTIQTQNVSSGPPCLSSGAASCAILTGSPTNPGPELFNSLGSSHLSLKYIAIDGNIAQRRANFPDNTRWVQGIAYNGKIHQCEFCSFYGFASIRAPQGTGLEFEGDNAVFNNVVFRDNGWGEPFYPGVAGWSDGLTIWSSNNLQITNSTFVDNSDVNLILGNGQNAVVQNNTIGDTHNFAFAGFMLDNFGQDGEPGIFTGTVVSNNTIYCANSLCGIGIMAGNNFWSPAPSVVGATITANTVTLPRQGILTDGANGTQIVQNQVNELGTYSLNSCTANPLSITSGDNVSVSGNNAVPSPNQMQSCGPQDLPNMLLNLNGVDPSIAQLYRAVLGRDPDSAGGIQYTKTLHNGTSLASLRASMANGAEAQADLNALYLDIFKRPIDSSGQKTWTNYLAVNGTIAQMRVLLLLSPEGLSHAYDQ
jgi:hypothetical protein